MVAVESRRIPHGVAWGALGVLAWAAFSILTGGGSAHADEEPDSLLGEIAGVVSSTVDDTVTPLVEPVVAEVVAPVVQKVVTPVVKTVVEPVAQTVPVVNTVVPAASDTATAVVEPVTEVLRDSPVSHVTAPVVTAVADVPVVGELLGDLGVTTALTSMAGAVDKTAALLGDSVATTVLPIVDHLDPTSPTPTAPPTAPVDGVSGDAAITVDLSASSIAEERTALSRAGFALASEGVTLDVFSVTVDSLESAVDATGVPATPGKAAHAPPASPAPSSSAGNGGGHAADGAQFRAAKIQPLHAWTRAHEASDDDLPSSPVADTDISPD